jgi:uncharacterized protein
MIMRVVVDTNILISALLNAESAPRGVLELCLRKQIRPLIGAALFSEHQDVLARDHLFATCRLSMAERTELLNALMSVSEWISIHFLWRPKLRDEGDNHLIELAVAGGASAIISANRRDLMLGELLFPQISVLTAGEFLSDWRKKWRQ